MNHIPNGLWECGTYWHLETRPEELENILGSPLHTMAPFIDAKLKHSSFQTFVHGDAKLANFCFSADHTRAAAVDFQYVGKGCGMKDVAYFISSCMNEEECAIYESQILDCYFSELRKALTLSNIDPALLEEEWRALYHVSWADFQRFILGWSPQHKKNNTYSQRITDNVIEEITESLLYVAQTACIKAGTYIKEQWKTTHQTSSKGLNSEAADIVTQIDIQAQDHIIQELNESIKEYNLGILAEEGEHNNSRFDKHAFWTIDPLDGTLFYTAQKEGFAVSIALVTYSGNPIMGIVYDPVTETLYHAVNDQGFFINNKRYSYPTVLKMEKTCTLYADQSLKKQPNFKRLSSRFHIRYTGGAVMNTIHVITGERSLYVKPPKETLGGCAIWDIAAVSLFLKEAHGRACLWDGSKILLNRKESIYFNDVGLFFSSPDINATELMNIVRGLL
jgi:fructose-1,6-bisphosphatase/inositol monophosphatase family enzyme